MKKYKLLYFVSEDEYFLSHKIDQAKFALNNNFEVLVVCKFSNSEKTIKSHGFKTKNINLNRRSVNPFTEFLCLLRFLMIVFDFKPDIIQSVALKPILYTSILSPLIRKTNIVLCVVGLGYLFINKSQFIRILKNIFFKLISFFLVKNKASFIFQNNRNLKKTTSLNP